MLMEVEHRVVCEVPCEGIARPVPEIRREGCTREVLIDLPAHAGPLQHFWQRFKDEVRVVDAEAVVGDRSCETVRAATAQVVHVSDARFIVNSSRRHRRATVLIKTDRRNFLQLMGMTALTSTLKTNIAKALEIRANNRTRTIRDVEHIIMLTQENRPFDHHFGTLRGVRGFSDPRAVKINLPLQSGAGTTPVPVFLQPAGAANVAAGFGVLIAEAQIEARRWTLRFWMSKAAVGRGLLLRSPTSPSPVQPKTV